MKTFNAICFVALILFSNIAYCYNDPQFEKKVDTLFNKVKSGEKTEACLIGHQILNEYSSRLSPKTLEAIQNVTNNTCMAALEQQFNSPNCQKYQNAKVKCAAAVDYPTCMRRMGASLNDYAYLCGD